MTPIDIKYQTLGGLTSFLGNPIQDEAITPDGVGRYRHYERGSIHWHPDVGAFSTNGGIRWLWSELGWEVSFLGYPMSDEEDISSTDLKKRIEATKILKIAQTINEPFARISWFQRGAIIWLKENRLLTINEFGDLVFPKLPKKRRINQPALWIDIKQDDRNNISIKEHGGYEHIEHKQVVPPPNTPSFYAFGNEEIRENSSYYEEELLDYLLSPILTGSDEAKSAYLYENNCSEYREFGMRRNEIIKLLYDKQYKVAPSRTLDIELLLLNASLRKFEEWFKSNGYEIPDVDLTITNTKKIWKKGKKAAATYCISRHSKRPNLHRIDVCRDFLREWILESNPEYTPEMLSNYAAKLRSEENWGKREIP